MDSQFVAELRDLWMQNGPVIDNWDPDAQAELAIALYRADERLPIGKRRYWLCDALAEWMGASERRKRLVDALERLNTDGQRVEASNDISSFLYGILTAYPIDSMQAELDERLADFIGWRNDQDRMAS